MKPANLKPSLAIAKLSACLLWIGCFLALFTDPALGAGDWVMTSPRALDSFSVSAPLKLQEIQGRDEWRATDGAGRLYSVGMGFYTNPAHIDDPRAFMQMMVKRLAAHTGAKVAYSLFFKYQYAPACEFKLVDVANHQVSAGRYFLVNQWFYFMDYTTGDKTFVAGDARRFFESFRMINPDLKDLRPYREPPQASSPAPPASNAAVTAEGF